VLEQIAKFHQSAQQGGTLDPDAADGEAADPMGLGAPSLMPRPHRTRIVRSKRSTGPTTPSSQGDLRAEADGGDGSDSPANVTRAFLMESADYSRLLGEGPPTPTWSASTGPIWSTDGLVSGWSSFAATTARGAPSSDLGDIRRRAKLGHTGPTCAAPSPPSIAKASATATSRRTT
jgi:hypothetical protein